MTLQIVMGAAARAAQAQGGALVALESTVISHGLPRPHNLELARALEAAIRAGGAIPATIGLIGGRPIVGLSDDQIEHLATADAIRKVSRRDLGAVVAQGHDGATTVAGTMALAVLAGIEVFATGGIGGVHRGAEHSWDVSADLTELSRSPVLVVCAGAKSILDLPATAEMLETLGVPVVGFQTDELPAFYCRSSGLPLAARADAPAEVAAIWRAHRALGGAGMLLVVPPPADVAADPATVEAAIQRALARAAGEQIRGAAITPFLLAAMAEETAGESRHVNVALLRNNAAVAAQVAVALAATERS